MFKVCILCLCVLRLSAQDATSADTPIKTVSDTATDTPITASDLTTIGNETEIGLNVNKENDTSNANPETKLNSNQTVNVLSEDIITNTTVLEEKTETTQGNKDSNETFVEKVEHVMKRLFKREVVGSLVDRNSDELRDNPKITVPMFFQPEYYQLRLRKQEIERAKKTFEGQNRTVHEELIQNTWEKLVNWSKDHLAFEDKIIDIHKIKTHAHIQKSKDFDSDATKDSEDEILSVDSDEDSDKSMRPEFATVKCLAEVNDRYTIEKNIEEIQRKIKDNPKEEDNEKNRLLLKQYEHELKMVDLKYDRIRTMKLNRKFVEDVWKDKEMIDRKKKEDTDEDL